jgi:hypothetical protein
MNIKNISTFKICVGKILLQKKIREKYFFSSSSTSQLSIVSISMKIALRCFEFLLKHISIFCHAILNIGNESRAFNISININNNKTYYDILNKNLAWRVNMSECVCKDKLVYRRRTKTNKNGPRGPIHTTNMEDFFAIVSFNTREGKQEILLKE